MKTNNILSTSLWFGATYFLFMIMMCGLLSAQTTDRWDNNNRDAKTTFSSVKEKIIADKSENILDNSIKITTTLSDQSNAGNSEDISNRVDPLIVSVSAGSSKIQKFVIKNQSDSTLVWDIVTEGSNKLLFRKYIKDRDILELTNGLKENFDAVLPSVYKAEKKLSEINGGRKTTSNYGSSIEVVDGSMMKKQSNIGNSTNTNYNIFSSDKTVLLNRQKNLKTEINNFDIIKVDKKNYSSAIINNQNFPSQPELFKDDENSAYLNEQINVFRQWYKFEECGYPEFNPTTDLWEVSDDNGDHWQQIFLINGESYVVKAECFNPVEFLERISRDSQTSWTSELTTLSDFMESTYAETSPHSTSGIIPAHKSEEIKVSFDASNLKSGYYDSRLVLTDLISMKTLDVVPIHITISPQGEKENPNYQLLKQHSGEQLPDKYELSQNYPNPFNPSTTIKYSIPATEFVTLKVYDILGREVASLINEQKQAGWYEINFDAFSLSSGTYFYRIQAGDFIETKKMVLLK